jgi:hypothetical protein
MALCANCGNQLGDNANFCDKCGHPTNQQRNILKSNQEAGAASGQGLTFTSNPRIHTTGESSNVVGTILSGQDSSINIGGEHHTGDSVQGDKIGGDKIGGDKVSGNKTVITGGTSVFGDHSQAMTTQGLSADEIAQLFASIYQKIEEKPNLSAQDKTDLKAEVDDIKAETNKKDPADINESFLARRLRNIERMAPDIIDTIITTAVNPVAGLVGVWEKIVANARKVQSARSTAE